jgi:hypothetical protein
MTLNGIDGRALQHSTIATSSSKPLVSYSVACLKARFIVTSRADKPREYFAKFLQTADEAIDYRDIPATVIDDWQDAEVLLPVTAEEFHAIQQFIKIRRLESLPSQLGK